MRTLVAHDRCRSAPPGGGVRLVRWDFPSFPVVAAHEHFLQAEPSPAHGLPGGRTR